jgi:predicted methyltransferase
MGQKVVYLSDLTAIDDVTDFTIHLFRKLLLRRNTLTRAQINHLKQNGLISVSKKEIHFTHKGLNLRDRMQYKGYLNDSGEAAI